MGDEPGADDRRLPVPYDPEAAVGHTDSGEPAGLTRRRFLTLAAGGAAAAGTMTPGQWLRHTRRAAAALAQMPPGSGNLFIEVERDVDLMLLGFEFVGFSLLTGLPVRLVPDSGDARIIVHLPPQAIGEAVYFSDSAGNLQVDPAPILSELAKPSRLVFTLPPGDAITLPTMTAADLLDWSSWRLEVPPVAQVGTIERTTLFVPPPQPPDFNVTEIECPYALSLSPTDRATFNFRKEPLTATATECWGAILTGDDRVVAAWARDYPESAGDATPSKYVDYFSVPADAVP